MPASPDTNICSQMVGTDHEQRRGGNFRALCRRIGKRRQKPERAAIVTGGSRGSGPALYEALGEVGDAVPDNARKPDTLEQTAERLRGKGYDVEHVAANMADEDAIRSVVERHRERFGRLDVLVNNAGV